MLKYISFASLVIAKRDLVSQTAEIVNHFNQNPITLLPNDLAAVIGDDFQTNIQGGNIQNDDQASLLGSRALQQDEMGILNNYGCWCYFEENHGKGRGKPRDELDKYCKQLQQGYTCIIMDQEAAGDPCVPWEIPYNSSSGIAGILPMIDDIANLEKECNEKNEENSCARKTCKVETMFLVNFYRFTFAGGINGSGQVYNMELRHDNPFGDNFVSNDITCPIHHPQGVGDTDEACCGEYPFRVPYHHKVGLRECCDQNNIQTIFLSAMFDCCPDGSISYSC